MSSKLLFSDEFVTVSDKFIVVLDSRNATYVTGATGFNSSVVFDFADPIFTPANALKMNCSVMSFTCPNSMYNMNEQNSTLNISISGVSSSIVVPYGNYNAITFMTVLSSLILAIYTSSGFTIVLNNITNQFTIAASSQIVINGNSSIFSVMGFQKGTSMYGTSLIMPYTCNFNGIQNLNVFFDSVNTSNMDSFSKSNSSIIQSVPIDANQSQISFVKTTDFEFSIRQPVIDSITISLHDDLTNLVNLNGQHWNLTLCFSLIEDISRFTHETNFRHILKTGYAKSY